MIKEEDLLDAIAECQGQRNPNANTCIKLAAYYTILNQIRNKGEEKELEERFSPDLLPYMGYSTEAQYDSGTEFSDAIRGRDINSVLPIIDDLMTAVNVLHPKLYNATLAKIDGLL